MSNSNIINFKANDPRDIIALMDREKGLLPFDLAAIISSLGSDSIFAHIQPGNNAITSGLVFPEGSKYKFDVTFYTVDSVLDGYEATLSRNGEIERTWTMGPGIRFHDKRTDPNKE